MREKVDVNIRGRPLTLRKAEGRTKEENNTNLHATVSDLPLEFLAILSGEIPDTIGSTKGWV